MTDTDTPVNYARSFISRACIKCGVTFDLDPALYKRRTCFACSPAGPPRPPLPPPAAELRVPWTAEREARGASSTAGTPRCLSPGCPVRWSSPPSRPCPDHQAEAEDEIPLGTVDPRLAALPDAPVLSPAERAARRARLVAANEQLMRGRGAGWVSPASERQRTRERDRHRPPPRLTVLLPAGGAAVATVPPPRCAVAVTAGCATGTASAVAAGACCTITEPDGWASVIAALPWSAAAGVTAGLATASAAGCAAAVRSRGSPAQALLRDCHRSNRVIAAETGVNRNAVAATRIALETAGMIPFYRAAPGPRTHPIRKPRLRAEIGAMLLTCHEQSNKAVARLTGCDKELVGIVRHELEAEGLIPVWRAPRSTRNAFVRPGTVRR